MTDKLMDVAPVYPAFPPGASVDWVHIRPADANGWHEVVVKVKPENPLRVVADAW
jgi:hypothetical protein